VQKVTRLQLDQHLRLKIKTQVVLQVQGSSECFQNKFCRGIGVQNGSLNIPDFSTHPKKEEYLELAVDEYKVFHLKRTCISSKNFEKEFLGASPLDTDFQRQIMRASGSKLVEKSTCSPWQLCSCARLLTQSLSIGVFSVLEEYRKFPE
jgi:hypothetical protein